MVEPTNNEQDTQNQTPESAQNAADGGSNMRLLYGVIAVIVLLALGAAYVLLSDNGMNFMSGGSDDTATTSNASGSGPVATVNGEEITREQYNNVTAQIRASAGDQASDEQIKNQALDTLIDNTLLRQQISSEGVTAPEADVQAEIDALKQQSGGDEAFAQQLESANISEEELRSQISNQLAAEVYLRSQVDLENISVSEEEITSYYEQLSANNEIGALEDVRTQIEQQLTAQKQQQKIQAFLDELRANAEVEIMI